MAPDTVRRYGLLKAVEHAGLNPPGKPRLRFHDLRHCFASLLIAQGVNVDGGCEQDPGERASLAL